MAEANLERSYAIRRVNPFLGVLQILESENTRAVSANGVVWDIELGEVVNDGWGSGNLEHGKLAYYHYGLWSEEEGLVDRPLAPQLEGGLLKRQAEALIVRVREHLPQLPFKLQDKRELWLFDQHNNQPLALLATAIPGNALPSPEPKWWAAGAGADGVPSQRRYPAADNLETLVKQCAGFNVHKHWITRQDDGEGMIEKSGIRIEADAFPAFLLTQKWGQTAQKELAKAYVEWTAPSLLTLQNLTRDEREYLEKCLCIQSQSVEHHWRLYPETVDEKYLRAARVQCRLQKANQCGQVEQ